MRIQQPDRRPSQGHRRKRGVLLVSLLMLTGGLALAPTTAAGDVLRVDDDNAQCTGANHDSIQAAVDAASSGDTVVVCSGTYEESVTIPETKDGLTLDGRAKGVSPPTIVGDGTDEGDEPHAAIHVKARGSGATLEDVTIRELTIRNPTGTYGIFAGWGGGGADVTGLTIENNTIEDIATDLAPTPASLTFAVSGLYVRANYDGITVADNIVRNVVSDNWVRASGLSFSSFIEDKPAFADGNFAKDTVVRGNTIERIKGVTDGSSRIKGISASGEFDGMMIVDNTISNVTGSDRALGVTLTENLNGGDIDDDGNSERVGPRNFVLRDNTISEVDAAEANSLFVGGYEDLGDDHVVTHNTLLGPVARFHGDQPGFQIGDADRLDAPGNWWGSPLGPTHEDNEAAATGTPAEGLITGSPVGDFVDYEPWCESFNCLAPILQSP